MFKIRAMPSHLPASGDKNTADLFIESLLLHLKKHALNPMFEKYGNFVIKSDPVLSRGVVRFWGNFLVNSFVFSVDTDEPEIITRLETAIRKNQKNNCYRAARINMGVDL